MSCDEPHDAADCLQAQDRIYEYLHFELDAEQLVAIRAHLKDCVDCLHEYDLEQAVRDLLYRSCHCTAPTSLRSAIIAQITRPRMDPAG